MRTRGVGIGLAVALAMLFGGVAHSASSDCGTLTANRWRDFDGRSGVRYLHSQIGPFTCARASRWLRVILAIHLPHPAEIDIRDIDVGLKGFECGGQLDRNGRVYTGSCFKWRERRDGSRVAVSGFDWQPPWDEAHGRLSPGKPHQPPSTRGLSGTLCKGVI